MSAKNERRFLDKLFGGVPMSWTHVVIYAVAAAVITAVFLIVPVFADTSFERMGVNLEAWVLLGVLMMTNCRSPKEAAVKTFVFFLISQPLIYLLQVPFSWQGWGLFRYYPYWFLLTLLTIPVAYIGWYITKKNWLSLLILYPVLSFLGLTFFEAVRGCMTRFPHLLVTALFCVMQIVLYVLAFLPDPRQKIIGLLIPVTAFVIMTFMTPQVDLQATETLPDSPSFSEAVTVEVADTDICMVEIHSASEGRVYIYAHKYGTTEFTVTDGETVKKYSVEVYSDSGIARIAITPLEP